VGAFVGTINKIEEVGLDRLVFAYVKNFKSLVPRGSIELGDSVVFIEPDSVLPDEPWAESYKKYAPKRVKPIKLAGFLTEGIIIKLFDLPLAQYNAIMGAGVVEEGTDVSTELGITHYEPPLPTEASAVGRLPTWLPKTDEIRWEHLPIEAIVGENRLVTLKIDGSSTTYVVYRNELNGDFDLSGVPIHIYSRSLQYEDDKATKYSRVLDTKLECGLTLREEIVDAAIDAFYLHSEAEAVVFRGELYGEGIQRRGKNPHASLPLGWKCFGAYALMDGTLYKLHFPSLFCVEGEAAIDGEYTAVDEDMINRVMNGSYFEGPYEGVVIHFPETAYKKKTYTSCKVLNKVYDSQI